jgi:hypothetical protein
LDELRVTNDEREGEKEQKEQKEQEEKSDKYIEEG